MRFFRDVESALKYEVATSILILVSNVLKVNYERNCRYACKSC